MVALNEGPGGAVQISRRLRRALRHSADGPRRFISADIQGRNAEKDIKVKLVMQPGLADRGGEGLFFFFFCNIDELSAGRNDSSRAGEEEEQKT